MLSYPVVLAISAVSLAVVGVIVGLVSGSFTAIMVVLVLSGLVAYVLHTFGYLNVNVGQRGLEVDFHENSPAPAHGPTKHKEHKHPVMQIKEVFFVSGNNYSYNEAAAVCAAQGAELASYDQVMEAFSLGAEWCGYGWSQGSMALFPTQASTWSALQQEVDETKRTACGRPGVNGGYFDPRLKFGVNCYGTKPRNTGALLPAPLPGTDSKAFDAMVAKFKSMLSSMKISPFNRDIWSETGIAKQETKKAKSYLSRAERDVEAIPGTIEKDIGAVL